VAWRSVLLVLLVAGPAAAEAPARHALHWVRARGAERCIDPQQLAERVEALTGPAFVSPAQAEISLEGEIAPAGRGFRARLVSTGADGVQRGERVLASASSDCRWLDAALAFVIALTIDPGLSLSGQAAEFLAEFAQELAPEQALLAELTAQRSPEPAPARDVLQEAAPPASPSPPPIPPPSRPAARYVLGLAAATFGRSLPAWMFGVRASFMFDHARLWPLVLGASAFPSTKPQSTENGDAVTFQAYDAALSVCPELRWRTLGLRGCAGLALAYLHARGSSFEPNRQAEMWDPTLALGGALSLALGRSWSLGLDALMRVRLTDQSFELRGPSGERLPAHTPPRLGFLFSLGPHYEF
jgi:hypothetical protein